MQIQIKAEDLQKYKLFIATPMYGGQCLGMYMKSCLDLQNICLQYKIETRFSFIFNESLITRARNYLTDEFIRSGFTHLMFIDSDIHYDPRDIIALLALDKDIIGAPYPKKSIKWPSVIEAVKRKPDIQPTEVEKVTGDYVFNAVVGTGQFSVAEPLEVMEIGTGMMMVKKEVFELWKDQYPQYSYKPDHLGQEHFDGKRYIHAFFDCIIDRKREIEIVNDYGDMKKGDKKEVGGSDRYLSEDYFFCQQWRNMGGKIHLCPWMRTKHVGTYAFTGDMPAVAQYVGAL